MSRCLLIVIVEKDFFLDVCEALEGADIGAFTCLHGTGTGVWQTVDRWVNPEKIVFLSVIKTTLKQAAFESLKTRVSLELPGRGIAFTMPVDGGIGVGIPQTEGSESDAAPAATP